MRKAILTAVCGALALILGCVGAEAQAPGANAPVSPRVQHAGDPAAVAHGRALYVSNRCSFCHGDTANGGPGGSLRTPLVLGDVAGEAIGPVIANGRGGMPAFHLQPSEIADIAEYLHSLEAADAGAGAATRPPQ